MYEVRIIMYVWDQPTKKLHRQLREPHHRIVPRFTKPTGHPSFGVSKFIDLRKQPWL